MFTCTDPAATLIRSLIGDADLPTGEGLRRVLNAGTTSLMTSLAAAPHAAAHASVPGDVCVLRTHGATTREGQQMLYAHLTGRSRGSPSLLMAVPHHDSPSDPDGLFHVDGI